MVGGFRSRPIKARVSREKNKKQRRGGIWKGGIILHRSRRGCAGFRKTRKEKPPQPPQHQPQPQPSVRKRKKISKKKEKLIYHSVGAQQKKPRPRKGGCRGLDQKPTLGDSRWPTNRKGAVSSIMGTNRDGKGEKTRSLFTRNFIGR